MPRSNSSVNGKTTKRSRLATSESTTEGNTGGGINNKKLPSYRKPEHFDAVAGLLANEGDIFLNNDKDSKDDNNEDKSRDDNDNNASEDDNQNQIGNESTEVESINDGGSEVKLGERDSNSPSKDAEEGEDEDFDENDSDIAENIHTLKASVDQVLMRLKDAAQTDVETKMDELGPAMETHRTKISTMMSKVSKILFAEKDEIRLKAEELVYELLTDKIVTQFQEQVDLWISQASDDIDDIVANLEDEGLDVNEIDDKLAAVELDEKLPDLHEEIERIADDLHQQLPYAVPSVTKDAVEGILEHLGQHTGVKFDAYEILELELPLPAGVTFTDEKLLAAISDGKVSDDDYLDKENGSEGKEGHDDEAETKHDSGSNDETKEVDDTDSSGDAGDRGNAGDAEVQPDPDAVPGGSKHAEPEISGEDGGNGQHGDAVASANNTTGFDNSANNVAGGSDASIAPDEEDGSKLNGAETSPNGNATRVEADVNGTPNGLEIIKSEDQAADATEKLEENVGEGDGAGSDKNNSPNDGEGVTGGGDDNEDGNDTTAGDAGQDSEVTEEQ